MADIQVLIEVIGEQDMVKATRAATRMSNEYKALDRAFNKGKINAQQYAAGIAQVDAKVDAMSMAHKQANTTVQQHTKVIKNATVANQAYAQSAALTGKRTNRLGVMMQQTGYQVGDFAVQVQSGTHVMVALGQQATQLVGTMGMLSNSVKMIGVFAALGIAIPILTAVAGALMRTSENSEGASSSVQDLKDSLSGISPLLDPIIRAVDGLKNAFIGSVNLLINNLDRLIVTAGIVATFFAGRLLASFVMFGGAVTTLTFGLNLLRATLIRLPLIGLVMAATELVLMFTRLVKSAGGFGNALSLLKDVGIQSLEQIATKGGRILELGLSASFSAIESAFLRMLASMQEALGNLFSKVGRGLSSVPGMEGVSSSLGVAGIDLRTMAGQTRGVEGADFYQPGTAEGASERAESLFSQAKGLSKVALVSVPALEKLREAMANADAEGKRIDIRDWFGGNSSDSEGSGSSGSGSSAIDKLAKEIEQAQQNIQDLAGTMESSMSDAFMSMVEGTKSFKDAMKDMARAVIKQLFDILVVQRIVGSFNQASGGGSGIVGAIMSVFQADGGAWNKGVQMYANGGVVGAPTAFQHSGGLGVMGEAGPEAIMPLKRGKNGKLGVQAEGGSQQPVVIHQSFNFSANGDESVKRIIAQEAPRIANLTQKQILDQRRRGGVFKSTFG